MRKRRTARWVLTSGALLLLAGCAGTTSLTSGEELMEAGNYDEAVRFYMERLSETPRSVEARIKLVQALRGAAVLHAQRGTDLEESGRLDAALVEYRQALSYNAEETRARQGVDRVMAKRRAQDLLAKGKALLDRGEVRAAAHLIEEARGLDPENLAIQELHREVTERIKAALDVQARATEAAAAERAMSLLSTKPVTLRFKETDIKEVLEIISKIANINILLDEGVRAQKVTSYVKDLSLRQAFGLILSTNRLFAKQVSDNSLIVIPDTPAKHQQYDDLHVRTFYLSNADAKVVVNLLRTILNSRQIFVHEKLNAVVVRDTPEKIALAERLLQLNDRGGGEVEIDLEILEVDRTKLRDLGIFFTDQYQAAFFTFPTGSPLTAGAVTAEALGGVKLTGDLLFTNPTMLLNLIKTDTEAKTLANPTLRVIDRQKGSILIGERRPFQISQLTSSPGIIPQPGTSPAGTGAVTTTETRTEYRDVGLKLTFTPIIHLDGEVTVELNFEISSIGELVGGDLLPSVNTRTLSTFIKVKDGESRLLGGLIQDEARKTVQRSPFLGDLPIIGRLFRSEREEKVRRDIILSITPRIVTRVQPPAPGAATFWAGTGQSFEAGPITPVLMPAPPVTPVAPPPPVAPPVRPGPGMGEQ